MKRILVFILILHAPNIFGQDILQALTLEKHIVESPELDSLIGAFLKAQSECVGQTKNTATMMRYEPNAIGDTNAITLRVVHARDLNQREYRGFIENSDQMVFLYNGIEKLDLLKNTSVRNDFMISQRITYGNYLINDEDTLYIELRPYESQWTLLQKGNSVLYRDSYFDHPCNIKEEEKRIEKLLKKGWQQP